MIDLIDPKLPDHYRALRALTYDYNIWKTGESHDSAHEIPDGFRVLLPDPVRFTHYRIFWQVYGYFVRIDFLENLFAGTDEAAELEPRQSIVFPISRNTIKCNVCDGSGLVPETRTNRDPDLIPHVVVPCKNCRGVGALENRRVSTIEDPVPPVAVCQCGGTRFTQKVTEEQLLQKDPVDGWIVVNTVKRAGPAICEKCQLEWTEGPDAG